MGRGGLKFEIWRCLFVLCSSSVAGAVFGQLWFFLFLGALGYLIWLFISIYSLEEWIHRLGYTKQYDEELHGLWQDVSYDIHLILNRHAREKQRLQTIVDRVRDMTSVLTDAVILIDAKGNMEWWNSAAQKLFNFRDIDHGHKLTNLIRHPRFIHYFDQREYRTPLELTMWRKDQHLEFQVHALSDGERLVIARDITRLFKLEQMRKDFVANVSHELRTPLTVIRGYIETLNDSSSVPEHWHKALQQMEQQAVRMTSLTNDLIALTKLETDQKDEAYEVINIAELVAGLINEARTVSGDKNHQIQAMGDADLGIIGNRSELRSAISNLVINAINYSIPDSLVKVNYRFVHDGAEISVIDHGIGIDPKHIPRLTERFYRVDAGRSVAAGGTGLGLAIVKHILLRHNADLRIESALGKGSTFTCRFPAGATSRIENTRNKIV